MTDQARPTRTADDQPLIPLETVMPLSGDNPIKLYVKMTNGNPQFSSDGLTFYDDMSWRCGLEYGLYITFQLLTPLIELTPRTPGTTLWFSPVLVDANQHRSQLGCVPPVTAQTTFSFYAGAPGAARDPQIVVTPINGPDPDDCDPRGKA